MIQLIVGLALLGFILWLIFRFVPMPKEIRTLILVVTIVLIVLYLLDVFGVLSMGPPLPRLR